MKNVHEVLREKELDLVRVREEVEALRCVAPLLAERNDAPRSSPQLFPSELRHANRWPLKLEDAPSGLTS